MKHDHTNQLYLYWNRIRGSRSAPERSAIEPADIRGILKDTFILSVDGTASYSFRLAGTRTCSILGREVKNSNFLDYFAGESRDAVHTLLHSTCDDATVVVIGLIGKNQQGQSIPLEAIFLPLRLNGKLDQRIIGCIAPLKMPYWAGMQPVETLSLASLRMIMPHQHATEIARPLALRREADMDELSPGTSPEVSIEGARRVRHLMVLDGGLH